MNIGRDNSDVTGSQRVKTFGFAPGPSPPPPPPPASSWIERVEIRSFDPIHHGRDESRRRTRAIPHGLVPLRLAEIKLERKSLVGIYRREEEKKSCLLVFPRRESCIPPRYKTWNFFGFFPLPFPPFSLESPSFVLVREIRKLQLWEKRRAIRN